MPEEAFATFRKYKDSEHIDLCGIHLHIGSQNPDAAVYTQAFEKLFESLAGIHSETGKRLKHVNLGGGFPVNYLRAADPTLSFPTEQQSMLSADFDPAVAIGAAWSSVTTTAGAEDLLADITLLVEPGRSIISDAGLCLTSVRNEKVRAVAGGDDSDRWLLTDAGFNILLSMETYKWYYHLISAERASEPHTVPYKMAGPLCDGGDVYFDVEGMQRLPDHRLLPPNVQPGEVLALLNCGAYSLSQASKYNGRFLPAAVLVRIDGKAELIRSRDKFEDLTANEIY